MNIKSVKLIYFSPTKTTQSVLEGIAAGIDAETLEHLDLTPPQVKTQEFENMQDELAIIGVPVYAGRVASDAAERLRRIKANNTPAVIVVLYGNRAYEDALLELRDLALETGFIPIAGGVFIGEHSFANKSMPTACGRPDADDLAAARDFGIRLRKKMAALQTLDQTAPLQVPGNFPYKEGMKALNISPVTQESLCTMCGTCASVCPTGAISINETVITDSGKCILCCACIKNCPTQARVFDAPPIKAKAEWLSKNCRDRKEPELYL